MTTSASRSGRALRAGLFPALLAVSVAAGRPAACQAQAESPQRGLPPSAAELPLSRIVLFSSGVAYYQRDGQVTGDQTVDFLFPASDINDLLKSMVVRDLDGGVVSGVRYASRDPLEKSLKGFAIDLTESPGLAAILSQARGEAVEVFAPERMAGTIVGVEDRIDREGRSDVHLNLLTEAGLRSARLSLVSQLRFADARFERELREALALLASSRDRDKKRVSVAFAGSGRRRVRVGYILASPVWKTSYRLVLGEQGAPHFLQGWGIVENTTDEPWKDVRIGLVAGRPISFVMDLYQPLYVPRPQVQPETYRSLRPQRYEEDLAADRAAERAKAAPAPRPPAALGAGAAPSRLAEAAAPPAPAEEQEKLDLSRGVQAVAQAGEVGSFFQYAIERPVTLARHESAMLPIVSQAIEGSRLSIYNQAVLAKHPLLGVKLRNATGLDLMAGPITVFDGGVYAGDAQIDDFPARAERLISYAIDLETEVATSERSVPEDLVSVRILRGSLIATRLQRKERLYTIKNSSGRPRDLLIEHPLDPNWELVSPESPEERTRNAYRFAVRVLPAEGGPATRTLSVAEKRTVSQSVLLSSVSDDMIAFYMRAREVSGRVKEALRALSARKAALADTVAARQEEERKLQQVVSDQARIRDNMARLDRESALYKRYVAQLESQENELALMRERVDGLRQKELEQRRALEETMRTLEAE